LGIKNADKLVPLEDDQKPKDPVTENQNVLKGKPLKAFLYQDHQAHMQVHMMMIQDPLVQQFIGQNPRAPAMQAALMAHISEHVGFLYRAKIEQQLGMALPPEDEKLPPEVEVALSGMMAQAAQQVLQQSQTQAAQQQAQQQAQDPVIQMQQQDLQIKQQLMQIKQQEMQIKQQTMELEKSKFAVDAASRVDKQTLEEDKLTKQTQLEAMKIGIQMEEGKRKLSAQQQKDGLQMGISIAKDKYDQSKGKE